MLDHDIPRLFSEAETAFEQGRYREALDGYTHCLGRRLGLNGEEGTPEFVQGDAVVIERLVSLCCLYGWFGVADDLLTGLEGLFLRQGNTLAALHSIAKRLDLAMEAGKQAEARAALERLERLTQPLGNLQLTPLGLARFEDTLALKTAYDRLERDTLYVAVYHALARYLSGNGQFRDSVTLRTRALSHASGNRRALAGRYRPFLRLGLALDYMALADLVHAEQELEEADIRVEEGSDPALRIEKLNCETKLSMLQGNYGRALARSEASQRLAGIHDFPRAEIIAALNHAQILILVNHTALAQRALTATVARATAAGDPELRERAEMLLALARLRGRSFVEGVPLVQTVTEMQGRAGSAIEAGPAAALGLPAKQRASAYLSRFEERLLQLQAELAKGDLNNAASLLAGIKRSFAATDSDLIKLRIAAMEATLLYYAGEFAAAKQILLPLTGKFRRLGLKPDLWQALRVLGWSYSRSGEYGLPAGQTREEADSVLAEMSATLGSFDQPVFLLNKWSQREEFLLGLVERLAAAKARADKSWLITRPFRRFAVLRQLNTLLGHIDRHKRSVAEETILEKEEAASTKAFPGLIRRLFSGSRSEASIIFFVLPDRLLAVIQNRGQLKFGVSGISRLELRDLIRDWHLALGTDERGRDLGMAPEPEPEGPGHHEKLDRLCESLASVLLLDDILATLPRHVRRLRFVPDDALHGLPFASLRSRGSYLIEKFAVHVDYDVLKDQPATRRTASKKAAVIGVSRGTRDVPALPYAANELTSISKILQTFAVEVTMFDSDAASRTALMEALQGVALFHIACHGQFRPDAPDQSGLILLPAHNRRELLSLRDVFSLNLSGLQQLTLSSCWSADNFVLPGRRVVSLPETFVRAGTQSVIGSLWPIRDDIALPLMERFYRLLKDQTRAEAVRTVQLEMISNSLPGCEVTTQNSPLHWAGITLYGSPGRISI